MWPILIKADDLFLGADLVKWSRFIRLVNKNNAHVDIGFISKISDEDDALKRFAKWLSEVNSDVVSFFDHGIRHDLHEYTSDSTDYYLKQFSFVHEFQRRIFGDELEGFGAPYNSMSLQFLQFYRCHFRNKYIYYPDIVSGFEFIDMNYVSYRFHVSFERKEQNYDPSFKYFRSKYQKELKENRPLVLQVHPNRWSDDGFNQFSEILTYLRRLGGSFLTTRKFIQNTQEIPLTSRNILKSNTNDWFKNRYTEESLNQTRRLINKILIYVDKDIDSIKYVVDFGAGVGDWVYILSSLIQAARFYAVEPNKDLAEIAKSQLSGLGRNNIEVINLEFHKTSFSDINLTLCNRALNYFDHVAYVRNLTKVSADLSNHFVGYQNIAFYLRGLLGALKSRNLDLARRRVNVLMSSLEYLVGMSERRTSEVCVPIRALVKTFEYHGFDLIGMSHQEGVFVNDIGAITGLVFIFRNEKRRVLKHEISHIGLVEDIKNGGGISISQCDPQVIEYIRSCIIDLHNMQFESLKDLFRANIPIVSQEIKYIISIIALFNLNKYTACEELLLLCNFNDF